MKCIVELFGDDRNGRKMIAWGRRIGSADAGRVFDAERRTVAQTFRPRFHSPRRFAILVSAMLGQSFTEFIFATNTDGSGKAASYVRALDMLGPILTKHYPTPIVGGSMRLLPRIALKLFRGEPAISGFDWNFSPIHTSCPPFSTDVASALHFLLRKLQPGHG